jgi:hypothetical protein
MTRSTTPSSIWSAARGWLGCGLAALLAVACSPDEGSGPPDPPLPDAGAGGVAGDAGAGSTDGGAGGAVGGGGGGASGGASVGCPEGTVDVRANGTLCVPEDELYFADDYEGTSLDANEVVGWEGLTNHPLVESYELNNIGTPEYAFQELRLDPAGSGRTVLHAQVIDDDPNVSGMTRAQASLRFADTTALSVYHTSHRMRLSPDLADFSEYPDGIYWFVLFEIWNEHNDSWDGDVAGSARWDLSLRKEPGVGEPLVWALHGEHMQPDALMFDLFWPRQLNPSVPIPLGTWFTLDVRLVRGEGTAGRLTVTLTVDGEVTQPLFDVNDTTVYPGHPELRLYSWQAYKLYLADEMLDWMRARGQEVFVHYNDLAWYKN